MFGGPGKRGPVRSDISTVEQIISWLLLAGLGAVGLAVYLTGQTYDPTLFSLSPEQLAPARPATEAETETARPAAIQGREGSAAALTDPVGDALRVAVPGGWQRSGELERFSASNLYEKINGRAEQYEAYDVVGLTCQTVTPPGDTGEYIDVFVYDMGTIEGAFGIYAIERSPDEPAVGLGRDGFSSGASLFFWHGTYYIQVLSSSTGETLAAAARQVGARLAAGLPDSGAPVAGLDQVPRRGLMPGTIQYFRRDALSLGFLTNTFVGQYDVDGAEVTAFVALLPSEAAADSILEEYRAYLADFGEVEAAQRGGAPGWRGDLGGFHDVVFRRGGTVAGVTLVEDADLAERGAARLWEELASRGPSSGDEAAAGN